MSAFDQKPVQDLTNFGDWFSQHDAGWNAGTDLLHGFGDWYEGPGGESATKIGLAALLAIAGGEIFGAAGGGGGEGGGGGGGGGNSGGMGQFAGRGISMLNNLLGGSGGGDEYTQPTKKKGILSTNDSGGFSLYNNDSGSSIDPSTRSMLKYSTYV